jgi:hypothetical protein
MGQGYDQICWSCPNYRAYIPGPDIPPRPVELPATDPNGEVDFEPKALSTGFPNPVLVGKPVTDPNSEVGFEAPA